MVEKVNGTEQCERGLWWIMAKWHMRQYRVVYKTLVGIRVRRRVWKIEAVLDRTHRGRQAGTIG